MAQPPGFVNTQLPSHVCHLQKVIYDLKQAPRLWFHTISTVLKQHQFHTSTTDPSLLLHNSSSATTFILIYVDDILITGDNPNHIHHTITLLHSRFNLKELGPITTFLGIQENRTPSGLLLQQSPYITDLLTLAGLQQAKSVHTPLPLKLPPPNSSSIPFNNPTLYRQLAGSLQYTTITRPDIAFAVNFIC